MSKLDEQRAELEKLLRRQGKEQRARDRKRKGSLRRRQAKARLLRLKGLIREVLDHIAVLVAKRKKGPGAAVRWALSQQGVSEKPDGSNWGHPVQNWILSTGYSGPVPWCGCFAKVAVVDHGKAKIPNPIRLGYTGYIADDARERRNGLREVPFGAAQKGDIVVFNFGHIAVARGRPSATTIPTIEGNTSPLTSGSQANGGTVAAKNRPRGTVECIARPKYPN